jgi:hypothetical protein
MGELSTKPPAQSLAKLSAKPSAQPPSEGMRTLVIQGLGPLCELQIRAVLRMPEAQRRAYRRILCVSSGAMAAMTMACLNGGLDPQDVEAFLERVGPHGRRAVARPWHLRVAFDMTLQFLEEVSARHGLDWCDACVAPLDLRVYAMGARRRCHRPKTWQDCLDALMATASIPFINRSCARSLDGISVFEEDFVDDLRGCDRDVLGYPSLYAALCYVFKLARTPPLVLVRSGSLPSYSRVSCLAAALLMLLYYPLSRRAAATVAGAFGGARAVVWRWVWRRARV